MAETNRGDDIICSRNNDASITVSTSTSSRSTFACPLLPPVFFFSIFVCTRFHPTPTSSSSSFSSSSSSLSSSSSSSLSVAFPFSSTFSFASSSSRPPPSSSTHLTDADILPNFTNTLPRVFRCTRFVSNLSNFISFSSSSSFSFPSSTTTPLTRVPSLLPQSVTSKYVSPPEEEEDVPVFSFASETATTIVTIACFRETDACSIGMCASVASRPSIVGTFGCNAKDDDAVFVVASSLSKTKSILYNIVQFFRRRRLQASFYTRRHKRKKERKRPRENTGVHAFKGLGKVREQGGGGLLNTTTNRTMISSEVY